MKDGPAKAIAKKREQPGLLSEAARKAVENKRKNNPEALREAALKAVATRKARVAAEK
jgi:hypothetical protein